VATRPRKEVTISLAVLIQNTNVTDGQTPAHRYRAELAVFTARHYDIASRGKNGKFYVALVALVRSTSAWHTDADG